jgi:hypothetical protein
VFKPAVQPNILVGSGGRAKENIDSACFILFISFNLMIGLF